MSYQFMTHNKSIRGFERFIRRILSIYEKKKQKRGLTMRQTCDIIMLLGVRKFCV